MKKVRVANRLVGEGEPCFVIAEAGVNHNGDVNLAKKMINTAKTAKADAVKFQAFKAEHLVTRTAVKATYQKKATREGFQYDMLKKLELTDSELNGLSIYAKKKGIIFLASPFDKESVDLLDELKVPAFKVPSGEITNFPLLTHIAKKRKPIILSTGMSTLREVKEALETLSRGGTRDIVLLHCVSTYPAKVERINLRAMETLKREFKLPVGLSDHTLSLTVPIAAAALEAAIIEKHFTLDKTMPGPDHKASLGPDELREVIRAIRDVEKAMGDGIKRPTKSEERIKKVMRRSIVAKVEIPKGTIITESMLDVKRPCVGIDPKYIEKIVSRKARRTIKPDEPITFREVV